MSQSELDPLSPGPHLFTVPSKNLTFEYIVHPPRSKPPSSTTLLIIQCPAWGIGSQYLQTGLAPLRTDDPNQTTPSARTLLFFHPRGTGNSTRPGPERPQTQPQSQLQSRPNNPKHTPISMSSYQLSSDLEDLRKHLHLTQLPTLLGHSNGGAIALAYAETYPDRVAKLILLNHQLLGYEDRRITRDAALRSDPRYSDALSKLLSVQEKKTHTHGRNHNQNQNKGLMETDQDFTEWVDGMWPVYFYNPSRYLGELRRAIGGGGKVHMSLWCYRGVYGCDRMAEEREPLRMVKGLERVKARTLVVFGRDDLACGVEIGRQSCDGIRDSRLVVYDQCGHFPWIEKGEPFFEDLWEFLVS